MRPHHRLRMLAAASIAAAVIAPATADAAQIINGSAGGPVTPTIQNHSGDSTDWELIAISAAGGITILAAGLTTARRREHTQPSSRATT